MRTIKLSLKIRACSFIALSCLFSGVGLSQELFEKRFDISFNNEPLKEAIKSLVKTQTEMIPLIGTEGGWDKQVTLDLKNVTLDEAMDKILASQVFFKDYMVTKYAEFTELELFMEKSLVRYFIRNKHPDRYYHIGDRLPDSVYTVKNYPEKTIRLSGLKKKLIILDLWGIHCSGCIAAMPRMQRVQEEFKDKVQVILVTRDSEQQVELLKKQARPVRETKLPSVTGENMLGSLFDYIFVPRQVWIDESGIIRYITNKEIGKEQYIKDFLDGKRLDIYETKDTIVGSE